MHAWLLESFGGIERMRLGETADPRAGSGQIVLRVRYAALNPADRYLAEGQYPAKPPLPHILGRDGIGEVIEIGQGVKEWKVGDEALILRSEIGVMRAGTLAEKVAAPVEVITRPPTDWSAEQSAGAPLVYLTAYQAYTQWRDPLAAGTVVVVSGASGGVGVAAIQLGSAMGLEVIGLSRGTSKVSALKELGVAAVFDPNDPKWRDELKSLLAPSKRRVGLFIDNIGGETFNQVLDTLGHNGKVACVGRLAGPVPQFNTASLFFRRIEVKGVFVGDYSPAQAQQAWRKALAILAKKQAKPVVDSVFEFDQAPEAFERLRQGPLGKVLIRVTP